MNRYSIINSINDWSPNIASLADRLLIGPQRELLQKVQNLNNRFGLSLNITRTYRWSPGYMDKIKDWMVKRYIEVDMKRKISTFFNQIDQKQWSLRDLQRTLREIDNTMYHKRRVRAVFQDNTDLIAARWDIFYNILLRKQQEVNETMPNVDLNVNIIRSDDTNTEFFSFTWLFDKMDMNIFIGNTAYPILMGKTEINAVISVDSLVMGLCHNDTNYGELDDGSEFIHLGNLDNGQTYRVFKAWNSSLFYNNAELKLTHPFISAYDQSYDRIINGNEFHNTCLGDLQGRIWSEFMNVNLLGMTLTLLQWNTTYDSRNTRPLNNVKQSFWGLPERVNHPDFIGVYGDDPANCQYPNRDLGYDEQETEYCNAVNCAFERKM